MKKIFWKDGNYEAKGGIYLRNLDIHKFIQKIEENGEEVVGIELDTENGSNLHFIIKK